MTALALPGSTPPWARLIGWTPTVPGIVTAYAATPRSAGEAGQFVFNMLKDLRARKIDPMAVIGPNEYASSIASTPPEALHFPNISRSDGRWYFNEGYDNVWQYATLYLLAYFAGGNLPEDMIGELGSAKDWPDQGDNLEQRIFSWGLKTVEWDEKIPHYELRKVLQIQKWSAKDEKWRVYNQWGHDLTFEYDPVKRTWSAGADIGEWLNEHGKEIFTAFNVVFTAASAMTGYGTVISALQVTSKALAIAAATGDWNKIFEALKAAGATMAKLPGVAEFGKELEEAGLVTLKGVFNLDSATQAIFPIVAEAQGDIAKIKESAEKMRQLAAIGIEQVKTATKTVEQARQNIAEIRQNIIPPHLLPWFDKATTKGNVGQSGQLYAPDHPVPYYAKGIWDTGYAAGTLLSTISAHHDEVALATVGPVARRSDLLTFVRDLEKRYGMTSLERETRRADLKKQGYTDEQLKAMGYG
jgi:hypothetical protein